MATSAKNHLAADSSCEEYWPAEISTFANSAIITILVGPDRRPFYLHRDLICKHSSFFAARLNSSFKESTTHKIELPEDDPPAFAIIVNWMYQNRMQRFNRLADKFIAIYRTLIKAYVLADKLCMGKCQNDILNSFQDYHWNHHCEYLMSYDMIISVVDSDLPRGPLRNFFVEYMAWDWQRGCREVKPRHPGVPFLDSDRGRGYLELWKRGGELCVELALMPNSYPGKGLGLSPAVGHKCKFYVHYEGFECPEAECGKCVYKK